MKKVEMTPIRSQGRLIPGGWEATVPDVTPCRESQEAYTRYFRRRYGLPPDKARRRAEAAVQKSFERGFLRGLRHSLKRWLRIYAERWPHLRLEDGSYAGFDPALMQNAFVPDENTGRRGKQFVDEMLREMAETANGEMFDAD